MTTKTFGAEKLPHEESIVISRGVEPQGPAHASLHLLRLATARIPVTGHLGTRVINHHTITHALARSLALTITYHPLIHRSHARCGGSLSLYMWGEPSRYPIQGLVVASFERNKPERPTRPASWKLFFLLPRGVRSCPSLVVQCGPRSSKVSLSLTSPGRR